MADNIFNEISFTEECNDTDFKRELYGDRNSDMIVGNVGQANVPAVDAPLMQRILDSLPRWIIKQLNKNLLPMSQAIESRIAEYAMQSGSGGDMFKAEYDTSTVRYATSGIVIDVDLSKAVSKLGLESNPNITLDCVDGSLWKIRGTDRTFSLNDVGISIKTGIVYAGSFIVIDYQYASKKSVDYALKALNADSLGGKYYDEFALKTDILAVANVNVVTDALNASDWELNPTSGAYELQYTLSDVKESDNPNIYLDYNGISESVRNNVAEMRKIYSAWSEISFAYAREGFIVFTALYDAPTVSIPIAIEITRAENAGG